MSNDNINNVWNKGCLVHLSVKMWGISKKIPKHLVKVDADPKLIRTFKDKIDKQYLQPLEKIRNEARTYIYSKSLPFAIQGVMFAPKNLISEIDNYLIVLEQKFIDAKYAFKDIYPDICTEAESKLGPALFNPLDYPPNIEDYFNFSWQFISLDAPGRAQFLSPEIYEREKSKFVETMTEFQNVAITTLRTSFAKMVDHLMDKLSDPKKKFYDTDVTNIQKFMSDFNALNINDDSELSAMVERCKVIIGGAQPGHVRNNDSFRQYIANNMSNIQNGLDDLMVDRPTRKLRTLAPQPEKAVA